MFREHPIDIKKRKRKKKNRHRTGKDQILRRRSAKSQGWLCPYCDRKMNREPGSHENPRGMTLDHVVPKSRGGTDEPSNLVACCHECNQRKGDGFIPITERLNQTRNHQ